MALIGELYKPDLVLMPIGRHFTMNPEDAALATNRFLKPRFVIPMHYGTYPILAGNPEELIKALGNSPTRVIVPQPGEKVDF
jgi:L-ascorbate metabolism protein UlaG (beta-lactamase superfamily)